MEFLKQGIVFLDRDGVIIEEVDYLSSLAQIKFIPGSIEAIKLLNDNKFYVVVISNQSGVARGLFPIEFVNDSHQLIQAKLKQNNAKIDAFYFCPHHPEGNIREFSMQCECRKPKIGMLERALKQIPANLNLSYVVGDKISDINTALNVNIKPILVRSGYGENTLLNNRPYLIENKVPVFTNLLDAVNNIIKK